MAVNGLVMGKYDKCFGKESLEDFSWCGKGCAMGVYWK